MAFLVNQYGEMWARTDSNIGKIPAGDGRGKGVYILYDGTTPVYIGKGNIQSRVKRAKRSQSRGQFWNYFSWYIIPNPDLQHDAEALLLRALPWYGRALTKKRGKFRRGRKLKQELDQGPDVISRRKPRRPRN